MPQPQLNPAEYCITLFGGVRATARALKISNPSICYWRRVGYVPTSKIASILQACRDMDIKVDRTQLIPR